MLLALAAATGYSSPNAISSPDPHCLTGILPEDSECCCSKLCGTCGGGGCQSRPGGARDCCCGAIAASGRKCSEASPPCTVAEPPLPPAPPVASRENAKRGFVADSRSCDDPLLLNVSGWFYDYNLDNNYRKPGAPGDCARARSAAALDRRFVPMNWCLDSVEKQAPAYINATFFMGFNEPNNDHNCNTAPREAAKAWRAVMDRWPESQLVSPATSGDGVPWFDAFFGNCSALYGKAGCRISHLAAHDYSCDPDATLRYLERLHDRYHLPVWLTEFSCGAGAEKRPTVDHARFMEAVLPRLDAADFVYRYSWMSAHDGHGLRGLTELVPGGEGRSRLTRLGHIWNS